MCESPSATFCVVLVVVSIIILIGCIAAGVKVVDSNEVAIKYNKNTQTLDLSQKFEAGTHFVGVGQTLIKFPKTVIDLDMQTDLISARTLDGLTVTLGTRIIYRLTNDVSTLASLYLNFGKNYESPFYFLARSAVNEVAGNYVAFAFWANRTQVSTAIQNRIAEVFGDYGAILDTFSLANFELPIAFQNSIIETDVAGQQFEAVSNQMKIAETNRDTRVLSADQQVQAIEATALAKAQAYTLSIDAIAQNIEINALAEALAYIKLQKNPAVGCDATKSCTLGLSASDLTDFIWLDTLIRANESQKVFSIKTPAGLVN